MFNQTLITKEVQNFLNNSDSYDEKSISNFVNNKLEEFTILVENSIADINKMKLKIKQAKDYDTSGDILSHIPVFGNFLGKSSEDKKEERTRLMLDIQDEQNKAIQQLTTIMQEIMQLSTCKFGIAMAMNQALIFLIAEGSIKRDGQTKRLSTETLKKFQEVQKFIQAFIDEHEQHSTFRNEMQKELEKKQKIDDEQHKLIETHYQEFINFKMQMENDTKEKENKISDLEFKISKKNTAFSIIISSLALIVSIVAIILQFIK
ncbi:hypothetical protein ACMU5N_000977 [Campylobacter coli]